MDVTATLTAPCAPEVLYRCVADLGSYPDWLEIVPKAVAEDGDEPAWVVDLRGKLGPFARSKRLRMVRTQDDSPSSVVFERQERDGRSHSPWILRADVTAAGEGSHLEMRLHYGGSLWGAVIERMLRDEIESSRRRLLQLVSERTR